MISHIIQSQWSDIMNWVSEAQKWCSVVTATMSSKSLADLCPAWVGGAVTLEMSSSLDEVINNNNNFIFKVLLNKVLNSYLNI